MTDKDPQEPEPKLFSHGDLTGSNLYELYFEYPN